MQRGESQRQLAVKVRCSDQSILNWETARSRPQTIWAEQLESVLKLPIDVLLSDDPGLLTPTHNGDQR